MKHFILSLLIVFTLQSSQGGNPPHLSNVTGIEPHVQKFSPLEWCIYASTEVLNKYNYSDVAITASFVAPSGRVLTIDAFYYQHFANDGASLLIPEGEPFWKLRLTPDEIGEWNCTLTIEDVNGIDVMQDIVFECIPSEKKGFLTIEPGTSHFRNDMGEPVFLVGENIAWANQPDGSDRMGYYLGKLASHQMNYAKLMMTPWCYQIEWWPGGLMNYGNRQKDAFLMDSIFRYASQLGINLQLAFSIHNELNFGYPAEDWTSNPYNIDNGGMCQGPQEFFTHPDARQAFKNRLRYLNARWGYATNLIGWELLSEADNFSWYGDYESEIATWSNEMADYLREVDVNKHLVTVGFAVTGNSPAVWQHENIGFTQMHIYEKVTDIEGNAFRQIGLNSQLYGKPMIVGEFGLGHSDSMSVWDPQGLAMHNSLWTSALSGSPVTVVPWFWENYVDLLQLYPVFSPVAAFMQQEPSAGENWEPMHLRSSGAVFSDWHIIPKYNDLSKKSPTHSFQLHTTGQLVPAVDSMNHSLFGPSSIFAGLRQPPELNGFWLSPSMITVETGSQAISATIQISIDGTVVLQQQASTNSNYIVDIPSGLHNVKIDNVGTGFLSLLELDEIILHDFLPPVRAFGLLSDDRALAWIHNRQHNWMYYYEHGEAPAPASGIIFLPLQPGTYELEWYNTQTPGIDSITQHTAGFDGLVIDIQDLADDLALKAGRLLGVEENPEYQNKLVVYPNPSTASVRFSFVEAIAEPLQLIITDIQGRILLEMQMMAMKNRVDDFVWDGKDKYGTALREGLYFYTIRSDDGSVFNGKILRY